MFFYMWIYNLLIYVENDFILDNFFVWKITEPKFFPIVYSLLFSINLIKMVKIQLKVV